MILKSPNVNLRAAALLLAYAMAPGLSFAATVVPNFSSFTAAIGPTSGATTPLSYVDSATGVTLSFSSPGGSFEVTQTFFKTINLNPAVGDRHLGRNWA